ncbi:peroxidase 4-like [Juglans microcarpa x Juglans regia]|uniref:peroxidase 4-like n=1 Tax=Juglans microcarpa x Juglans regia TaxID=2249226 RepID=UPI001B7DDA3E|nr:peroxidase 4-like [Juglans microcarpa x Juglans regia]
MFSAHHFHHLPSFSKKMAFFTASYYSSFTIIATFAVLALFTGSSSAQLSTDFYSKSCPKVFSTVQSVVKNAISVERRLGASLLRLHFHDCFVNGCDGSVLLDDTDSFTGEKTAGPNNRSIRGFKVVDDIKAAVEKACPGVVSCADILAIASRDSVVTLGGPDWDVKVGRRDSKTASFSDANSGVIPPPTSTLSNLINRFQAKGLSAKDMVALSGAHTIGQARCITFRDRIYNETNIDSSFAKTRQSQCPRNTGGRKNLAPLDLHTPTAFDNKYFKNLLDQKGLLHSDQILYDGGSTDSLVETYSKNDKTFDEDFVTAIIKMGDNDPLTGSSGEIRKNCRKPN